MSKSIIKTWYLFTLIVTALIVGCTEEAVNPDNPNNNIPVIINAKNIFTFTLHAQDFSLGRIDELDFSSDTIEVYLNIGNYYAGSGKILLESDGGIIYSDSLSNNKYVVRTDLKGKKPEKVTFEFDGFSGDISFVVKKKY